MAKKPNNIPHGRPSKNPNNSPKPKGNNIMPRYHAPPPPPPKKND